MTERERKRLSTARVQTPDRLKERIVLDGENGLRA